jgi:hypothetical protein
LKEEQGFHGYYDANCRAFYHHMSKSGVNQPLSIENLLSYRFYPHFHPYVAEFVERLVKRSIPGLQAADTQYYSPSNNDGTLEVLPDSTLVALNDDIEWKFPDESTLKASKGTHVFLPHGTWVRLQDQDGTVTLLPGTMKTTEPLAMVFYLGGSEIQVEANKGILTLNSSQEVRLPQGQLVPLPKDTQLLFLGCKPRPQLYSEIFFSFRLRYSLVANWKFDDGTGTLATDASENGNNGELIGGASWTREGKINGAISFDGEDNYVKVGNSATLEQIGNNGSDFSVAFWIYLREGHTGQWRSIMHKGNTNTERTFALWMRTRENRIHYRISTNANWNEGGDSVNQIELKRWTHICYIKKGGNTLKLYINGVLDSEVALRGTSTANQGPLYMGKDPWYLGFNGSLDDIRIYGHALSEKEIGEVASGLTSYSGEKYFPFDMVETPYPIVETPYPVKDLDFSPSGAYSVYNWELFYHVPITLAIHLSKNQRFEEAQQWFHYIFDPTSSTDDTDLPTPERFWKVKPFQFTDIKLIEEILDNLSSNTDPKLKDETMNSIEAWKNAPFRPHVVARYRQTAYMFKTVMAYLDNLIDWGDSLFRQDTGESINEATQLYVLAANILGPRPQAVPKKKRSVRPMTYASLRENLDNSNNVLRDLETNIPFDLAPLPNNSNNEAANTNNRFSTLSTLSSIAPCFCVPRNDKLLSYWDTVADRLFKIHNSLNIQGIFRQLPLFEPPIDPALLAKAAAAGLDVGAIVSGMNQPLPLVRFQFLVQKATEICQEVKSLGNNLLSAIEKEDNEALALLRAKHERVILGLAETVKYGQLQEAIKSKESLLQSLALAVKRYSYYERQLGKKPDEIEKTIPELEELDKDSLNKMKFATEEPEMSSREIKIDVAQDLSSSGGRIVSSYEAEELSKSELARNIQDLVKVLRLAAQAVALVPDTEIIAAYWGLGGTIELVGGRKLGWIASLGSDIAMATADYFKYQADRAAKIGSYARREQEWAFQSNLAAGEITQIFKQLRAAQIREAIAEREWKNHQQQIQFAEEIERFLTDEKTGKKANQAFYAWMKREVKGLYAQCFQFAFDIAKKAERALQHELGNQELSFIQFNYLAGKEGLLAGEKLYLDIKRMEMAYHELNEREYELTKHVSLLQVNPEALLKLRTTGICTLSIPEELFDMDCPGHYFRRIKSVAVSIPCVTGPYTSVNCTLTLRKSSIRKNALLQDGVYAREGPEDSRFSDHFGSMQSIVTSTAQNDSGLFETNLRDERYLPFEGSGVISEWQLQLPASIPQFDYDTISDVLLHFRYTGREGGESLRNKAIENLKTRIEEAQAAGSVRLFSIRHEFPTEWAKFTSIENVSSEKPARLTLDLRPEHYPFWSKDNLKVVKQLKLFAETAVNVEVSDKLSDEVDTKGELDNERKITLVDISLVKLKGGTLKESQSALSPIGPITLYFGNNSMEDLFMALTWGK